MTLSYMTAYTIAQERLIEAVMASFLVESYLNDYDMLAGLYFPLRLV